MPVPPRPSGYHSVRFFVLFLGGATTLVPSGPLPYYLVRWQFGWQMDVLEYWKPSLDWGKFKQGPLSDEAWRHFKNTVSLAHSACHWDEVANKQKITPLPRSFFEETKYQNKKRRDERANEIERSEGHRDRAIFLLAEEIECLRFLGSQDAQAKLYVCLRASTRHLPEDRKKDRWKVAAFTEFDSSKELADEPAKIIDRWCKRAGFND
jgi:hypothetical protein